MEVLGHRHIMVERKGRMEKATVEKVEKANGMAMAKDIRHTGTTIIINRQAKQ